MASMRLLNTESLLVTDFIGSKPPSYVILSHTWQHGQESCYQQWLHPADPTAAAAKSGHRKIEMAAWQARSAGFDWLWVDTICIDKTSSAELSEAINSMYSWYRGAAVCHVYLEDVPELPAAPARASHDLLASFRNSRWWTRGWTLQELLAPETLIFFAQDWSRIGTRDELAIQIELITGIRATDVRSEVRQASIARKMSWIALRQTTRVEDMAYCMLGLFDINMPLIYGEGPKAFVRLQEEIIKQTADTTIFCWAHTELSPANWLGLLAPNPAAFADSARFCRRLTSEPAASWLITNQGLSIDLPVLYTFGSAFLLLRGAQLEGAEGSLVMVPITASPHASYGHCRLYSPSGPIAVPDGQNLRHTSSLGRPGLGALRLLLSPGSPDVVDGLALTVSAAAGTNHGAAQSRGGDVVLLIDDELSGSPTGRPAAPHWLRAPYCRQRPLQLDWLLAAPSARTRVEQTGGVELARVTVGGDRQLLAGAVELYSAASGSSSCNRSGGGSTSGRGVHVRLFLAFELSPNELGVGAGGGKVKRHYCEIAEFVTPPPRDEMERLAASFVSKSTLEGWFEARLERLDAAAAVLAAGRGPQGQPWLVLSQKHFALRVLPELAISADSSQVVVVELSQNLHSARKSHKKDGLLRRILPRWAASDPTVESWLEAREALLHGPVGPSKS